MRSAVQMGASGELIIALTASMRKTANDDEKRDGALVESITFNRRVMGSTPALAVT